MYDNHPEWGPASHHPENPRSMENTAAAVAQRLDQRIDQRDEAFQHCDDN